jgi:ABC-type transport system involved in multi-copper enzyme maturation permease subunit
MFVKVTRVTTLDSLLSIHYSMALMVMLLVISAFTWLTSFFSDGDIRNNFAMSIYISMMLVMAYAAVRTIAAFSSELDNRTMDIMLTLPIERSTLFFGKIAGLIVAMIPLIASSIFFYFLLLSIVIGTIPNLVLSIALQLSLLAILFAAAMITIITLFSMLFRKTLYSLGFAGFYIIGMLFISPILNDFSSQRLTYSPNHVMLFPIPYATLAAGVKSVRVLNEVDPLLYVGLLILVGLSSSLGYLIFRRMDI